MASRNPVTISGNLVADPEHFAAGESSGVRLVVAESIGYRDRSGKFVEEEPAFWPVTIWDRSLGENVVASLRKGARVTITGRYRNNVWEHEGQKRSRLELAADEVSASLKWATAVVTRTARAAGDDAPPLEPPF